ncbi:MAG: FHA domain-containing protein [Labilithrix sp.]|nr:FHA domain-containing protein [Labilithrix sp.]MCW5812295.1 FHA domain-containing protein [Labilithrix sp.]
MPPPVQAAAFAPPPMPPPQPLSPPEQGGGGHPLAVAGGAPVEVRCPACGMATMVMAGQASVCFSCGQPLPKDIATSGAAPPAAPVQPAAAAAPAFPLTSAIAAQPLAPPPSPYGATPTSATILGAAGQFAIKGGVEVRVGRDPAACPITLNEPRVSGIHATLKFEAGQLFVRDEGSNNGTHVAGFRIASGTWTPVPQGAQLRFGPVEFSVRIDT